MAFDDDLVVGMDLGGRKIVAALVDAGGRVHGERMAPVAPLTQGEDRVLDGLIDVARALLTEAEASGGRVRGVGVGVPGTVGADGIVLSAAALGWRDFSLGPRLAEELELPVWVDSDANLAALGELHFGAGRGAQHLVWVSLGAVVRAALILDGKLYRGPRGAAGEIGSLLPGPAFLQWQGPGGALASMTSASAIAARARTLAEAAGLPLPADGLRAEEVLAAAAEGAGWARGVLDETVDVLAVALAAVQALLDPERIILGGSLLASAEQLLPAVVRRLEGTLPQAPHLVRSELGHRAAVLGAAAAVRASL